MTINTCDIKAALRCNPAPDNEMFRNLVLRGLGAILDASAGGSGKILPQVQKTFTQLNASFASFASLGLLDSTKKLGHLYAVNNTDTDIDISLDGGATVAYTVLSNSAIDEDLGNYVGAAVTSVQIRETGPATLGTAYFGGSY